MHMHPLQEIPLCKIWDSWSGFFFFLHEFPSQKSLENKTYYSPHSKHLHVILAFHQIVGG